VSKGESKSNSPKNEKSKMNGEKKMKTVKEIENTMKLHHIASRRGYISRKSAGEVESYKGKFGEGYIILRPRFDTTNYIYVEYYIAD
jgi:hypothetical protein